MENASKALLMAGAILIALVLMVFLIRSFSTVKQFEMSQLTQEEQKQLIAFNEKYTKFLGKYVYGVDVASLKNKYEDDGLVEVKILPEGTELPTGTGQDTQYYKCKEIHYSETTGKVDSITFEKVTIRDN